VRFRIENSSKDSYYRFEYLDVPFLVQYEGPADRGSVTFTPIAVCAKLNVVTLKKAMVIKKRFNPLSGVSLAAPLYTATNVDLKTYNAFVSLGGFVRVPLKERWVLQSELLFKFIKLKKGEPLFVAILVRLTE